VVNACSDYGIASYNNVPPSKSELPMKLIGIEEHFLTSEVREA
jgi:hypothetical protein